MNHFNPIRNQNYSLFFQNSPFASSLWPLNRGLFLPRSLGPKRLHSKWATLAPKIVLYFTHRNGPIFGAKTDLLDLECRYYICAFNIPPFPPPSLFWRFDGIFAWKRSWSMVYFRKLGCLRNSERRSWLSKADIAKFLTKPERKKCRIAIKEIAQWIYGSF